MPRRKIEKFPSRREPERYRLDDTGWGRPELADQKGWAPRIDVLETRGFVLVKFEIAGVPAEGIHLAFNAESQSLHISGRRADDWEMPSEVAAHRLEIPCGEFSRIVSLPKVPLDSTNIRAQMRAGMLMVWIPKIDGKNVVSIRLVTLEEV